MKNIFKTAVILFVMALTVACGAGKKENEGSLGDKKAEVAKLKDEYNKLGEKIRLLEDEIAKIDTSANAGNARLISVTPISKGEFNHMKIKA